MKKIAVTFLMTFLSVTTVFATGTSALIEEEILLDKKSSNEAQPKVFVEIESKGPGVQALTMGQLRKPVSDETVERQRELIYVLRGPGNVSEVFKQGFMVMEGPVLDPYRREQVAGPKGGLVRPAFLKGLISGPSPLVAAGLPDATGSSGFGSLWGWLLGTSFDVEEPDEDEMEMDEYEDPDTKTIEVKLSYDE